MEKLLIIFLICATGVVKAQTPASVEQKTTGIQTGLLGVWIHQERKLADQLALRLEAGMDMGIWGGSLYYKTGYIFIPVFVAEPRWYYATKKRNRKGKKIEGNNGNFLSIRTQYHPNWFSVSNYGYYQEIVSDASATVTWGMRRNIGTRFTFETGIGAGPVYYFAKKAGYQNNEVDLMINLMLRFGYRFKSRK